MNASTFLARTERDAETGCWNWTGRPEKNGYCRFMVSRRRFLVHRFSYELFVGPIPPGLVIDHLCRNRRCVNPGHLEVVTQRENVRRGVSPIAENFRKTHCPRGHEYDESNTRLRKGGGRRCRACNRIQVTKANRVPCADGCGRIVWHRGARCVKCSIERRQAARRLTQEMWHAGATRREIAEALQTTTASVGVKIALMRKAGWDMPHRGPGSRKLAA